MSFDPNFMGYASLVPTAEPPAYNFNYEPDVLPSCKITFPVSSNFCALFLQDDIFKSTIAVTLKLADRVLPLLLNKMVAIRGQLTVPEAAAVLFQYHHPNQTAINRLYVYRPNSSSHHQNSLHFGIHLV